MEKQSKWDSQKFWTALMLVFLQETTRRMENVRHFLKNASFLILTDGDEIGAAIFTE